MGKMYKTTKAEDFSVNVETGVIEGLSVTDNFTSINDKTKQVRELKEVTFVWDISLDDTIKLAFDAFKVKMRSKTLSKMSDKEVAAIDGETVMASDYIPNNGRTTALTAAEQRAHDEAMEKCMKMAILELGEDAEIEALQKKAIQVYDDLFAAIVEAIKVKKEEA